MKVYWTGDAIVLAELAAFGASSMLAYVWAVGGLCPIPVVRIARRDRLSWVVTCRSEFTRPAEALVS